MNKFRELFAQIMRLPPDAPSSIENYWRLSTNWSSLNKLGQSRVLRSSYFWIIFVPFGAKVLSQVGDQHSITIFGATFLLTLGLPFSWKIFFYASIAFSLASLLYSIFCPSIIKNYERFSDFQDEGKGERQIRENLISILNFGSGYKDDWYKAENFLIMFCHKQTICRDKNKIYKQVIYKPRNYKTRKVNNDKLKISMKSTDYASESITFRMSIMSREIKEEEINSAFWYVRSLADNSAYIARLICLLLFIVGFALLSLVLYENFMYVVTFT